MAVKFAILLALAGERGEKQRAFHALALPRRDQREGESRGMIGAGVAHDLMQTAGEQLQVWRARNQRPGNRRSARRLVQAEALAQGRHHLVFVWNG